MTLQHASSVNGCDNCGKVRELYHFDAELDGNPFHEAALCDPCTSLAATVDDLIADARGGERDNAPAIEATERLILWNEGQVQAKLDAADRDAELGKAAEGDERYRLFALSNEYLMAAGAHMRAAHDLRYVRDKIGAA